MLLKYSTSGIFISRRSIGVSEPLLNTNLRICSALAAAVKISFSSLFPFMWKRIFTNTCGQLIGFY